MKILKRLVSMWALALLAACGGGGGDAGNPVFGGGTGGDPGGGGGTAVPTASDLVLVLSAPTISNSGLQTVVATATALDANRNTIAGVPVTIAVDNGGTATASATSTNSSGTLTAAVGIGSDRRNRVITVTAISGALTRTATLNVADVSGTATATDLLLTLSSATIANSGTETVTATVTALDGNRNTLAGVPVTITVDSDATATPSGAVTASNGVVTAALRIGSNRTNRTITVVATSGALVRTSQLTVASVGGGVVPSDLVLSLSAPSIANDGSESVVATVTALNSNRNVLSGAGVTVSVDNGGTVAPSGTTTSAAGTVTATIGVGSDRSNRTITVTAISGTLTRTATLAVTNPEGSAEASDLVLTLSSGTIANNGTTPVTATITALDARRNTLAGVGITVELNNGGTALVSSPVTNASGVVTAILGIGADSTNRDILVTATSGTISRTAVLQVVNAPSTSQPVAADLSLELSASTLNNVGTNTVVATATAVDANRNVLAGIPVTMRVDSSALVAVSASTTNAQGRVLGTVSLGSDRSNRVVTVTATSGALTRSASFTVIGARLTASFAPRVSAGVSDRIEFSLVDANALPMAAQSITVNASNGATASGTTDGNGKYSFNYTAPAVPGTLTITAAAAGTTRDLSVEVSSGAVPPVASDLSVRSASLTATPSVVTINATSTSENQSELRALFSGRNNTSGQDNVPIPRVRASFQILNNTDGTLGAVTWVGGTFAISDDGGIARATFRPGSRSSPTDGVTIRLCWGEDDATAAACTKFADTRLTIVDEALSVNIRTNELIKTGLAGLTYIKEFVVMVVDAAGQAKADVQITPSVDLTGYYKGKFAWNGLFWAQQMSLADTENYSWQPDSLSWRAESTTTQPVCPNEDVNRNGIRDASGIGAASTPALAGRGEDLNWNGELDPRKADVAVKMVGSSKTDANGLAIVQIEYGKDLATWVDFVVTVTASSISGTEARARHVGNRYGRGNLPFPADAVLDETIPPPFVISPYGIRNECTNAN